MDKKNNTIDEEKPEETQIEEETVINDVFDLLDKIGVKVHEKGSKYGKDHILSNLSQNEARFVREQTKLAGLMKDYIKQKKEGKKLEITLKTDISGVIILSRAKGGLMLKALIKAITGEKAETIQPETQENKNFIQKLFTKR